MAASLDPAAVDPHDRASENDPAAAPVPSSRKAEKLDQRFVRC